MTDPGTSDLRVATPRPNKLLTAGAAITVVLACAASAFCIPAFAQTFKELRRDLPAVTTALISVPQVFWLIVGASAPVALVLKNSRFNPNACLVVDITAFGISAAYISLLVVALFIPLLAIIETIQ